MQAVLRSLGTFVVCMQIRLLIMRFFFLFIVVGPAGLRLENILLAIIPCNYMYLKGIR